MPTDFALLARCHKILPLPDGWVVGEYAKMAWRWPSPETSGLHCDHPAAPYLLDGLLRGWVEDVLDDADAVRLMLEANSEEFVSLCEDTRDPEWSPKQIATEICELIEKEGE